VSGVVSLVTATFIVLQIIYANHVIRAGGSLAAATEGLEEVKDEIRRVLTYRQERSRSSSPSSASRPVRP